ncbi:fumarate hydratase subunit beta [Sedimentibacter acidaminivorans]|jgi:fumarate hydratase subunit beta|uniref:Fumarate hydratase subunit beta n=1 Tax=Sedimentibacter acidaminivorans TaxID=913099 RepID=A0ABS4GFA6_9FIRM|nr:Fe-S-containing hydro-lyase [Sedimentibacter acidaminivorans]MBP1926368.1 fumarate hydratase subunit beta [Sedimentibacter acidaminivorans]
MEIKKVTLPLNNEIIETLHTGDNVLLTGYMYTGRDAAHKRLCQLIEDDKELPFDIKNEVIYYVGPAPAKPGYVIGPAGPTTSYRMDSYTVPLLEKGLKGMIGKGLRSPEVIDNIKKYKAVYFAAIGGAAALISKSIKSMEIICYDDLGTEAVRRLYVEDFPVIVVIDSKGNNLYVR